MSSARRRRREEPEEHENHERWLVTYADMVTLLMVLFIVMFSMSVVDEKKFNALKAGLAAGFGDSTSVMTGSESILEQPGVSAFEPVRANTFPGATPKDERAQELLDEETKRYDDARAAVSRLQRLLREIDGALREAGLRDDVRALIDERGLVLSLTSRHVVFEPDLAELSGRGQRVLDVIAPVLREIPDELRIGGHTNQVPVKPKYFETDWELSAARAITVLRYLSERGGIRGERMSASAHGHEEPLVDPSEPGSQRVNKRVDVVVLPDLSAETRELLDDVVASQQQTIQQAKQVQQNDGGTR
jgi:chemotaxis protein MotB